MVIRELNATECRQLLAGGSLGRIACARDGQPYITPAFFHYEPGDDALYSFATPGQRVEWMRSNLKVCVEIEKVVDEFNWSTVIIFGTYQELRDRAAARKRALSLLEHRRRWWLPGAVRVATEERPDEPVFYRIDIRKMTGRGASDEYRGQTHLRCLGERRRDRAFMRGRCSTNRGLCPNGFARRRSISKQSLRTKVSRRTWS